jgi:hypothetical protein
LRPLGIKALHETFARSLRVELDNEDYDSWHCREALENRLKTCDWYHFYDFVELVGDELKRAEAGWPFNEDDERIGISNGLFKRDVQAEPSLAAPHAPKAERQQLRVPCCDLVDSTCLDRESDPGDWRDIGRAYQQACAAVIQRFDGSGVLFPAASCLAQRSDGGAAESTCAKALTAETLPRTQTRCRSYPQAPL